MCLRQYDIVINRCDFLTSQINKNGITKQYYTHLMLNKLIIF